MQESIFHHQHMFCHVLNQRQEASLGVVPSVSAEFLLIRLQTLYHPRYSELVVALGTVQGAAITETTPVIC